MVFWPWRAVGAVNRYGPSVYSFLRPFVRSLYQSPGSEILRSWTLFKKQNMKFGLVTLGRYLVVLLSSLVSYTFNSLRYS